MKKILLLGALPLLMASCSNEEALMGSKDNGKAIGFSTYVGKATKGEDITSANLNKFYVYGGYAEADLSFNGVEVTKPESDNDWTYSPTKYWQQDKDYYFAAIAPSEATSYDLTTLKVTGYEAGEEDLIVATTSKYTGKYTENVPVALNFKHALAKVQIKFVVDEESLDVEVKDVAFNAVNSKGDLNVTYSSGTTPVWSNLDIPKSYVYALSKNVAAKYLLPQTITDDNTLTFTVEGTATDKAGEEYPVLKSFEVNLKSAGIDSWVMGNAYNYTVKLDIDNILDEIEFTADVAELQDYDKDYDKDLTNNMEVTNVPEEKEEVDPSEPGEEPEVETEETTVTLDAYGDTWVRSVSNPNINGNSGDMEIKYTSDGTRFYGLMSFKLPEDYIELKSANLRLVTTQKKGTTPMSIYNGVDFDESTTNSNNISIDFETISNVTNLLGSFEAKGQGTFALTDFKDSGKNVNPELYGNIEAWTNNIEFNIGNLKISEEGLINLLIAKSGDAHNDSMKFGTKEATDIDASETRPGVIFKGEDINPKLTITYTKKKN